MQLSSHCCKRLALSVTALVLLLAVSQPAQAQTYHAGAGLTLTGTTFSIANGGVTGAMIGLPLSLSASSSSPILTVTNTGSGYGIKTVSTSGTGTYGTNTKYGNVGTLGDINGFGVYGSTTSGPYAYGVYGINRASGNGDYGFLGGVDPVYKTYTGVFGSDTSSGGNGVFGDSSKGSGVAGISTSGDGGFFSTSSGTAVSGMNSGSGDYGLLGGTEPSSHIPVGVYGNASSNGYGVYGISNIGSGVYGISTSGVGVAGVSTNSDGINGATTSTSGYAGIYGYAPSGSYAGSFYGDVNVSGTLTAGAKNFKIDHPLDPEHKYLYHASIESDEMTDLYSGNVTTDANGNATVTMPSWFGALNTDFRYQLTCIGQFAQAIVGSKVKDNRFTIKTDKPDVEVSWQVTGVRHDAFALAHPMQVEQDKPEKEQGLYQNPEAFGQPESMGTGYAHRHKSLRPAGGG